MAKEQQLDLVEISPNANPPVCRITDYGKYAYEQKKLRKEQKKSSTTIKIKEIQLRPNIDPHDFTFKLNHAIDFLCEDMKVKVILRFRGKELRTKHIGLQTIEAFLEKIKPWGHCDTKPREAGRSVIVLLNPAKGNTKRGYEAVYTMLDNPHPEWKGGLLFRSYPSSWALGVAGKVGKPKIHGR